MPPSISDKESYLARLKLAVQELHRCEATYRRSVSVHETFRGETLWKGDVEIFWLTGHPKAKRCFAWSRVSDDGKHEAFETVLELPPVIGAATAVRTVLSAKQTSSLSRQNLS